MTDQRPRFSTSFGPASPTSGGPPVAAPQPFRGPHGPAVPNPPAIALPSGTGGLRSIDEQFATNRANGTATLQIPLPISQGRSGSTPSAGLVYDSGAGNGEFGMGWRLTVPAIARRTDRGIPRYRDGEEFDTFVLSGLDDLVPFAGAGAASRPETLNGIAYRVRRYRPRIEGDQSRIERWERRPDGDTHWRLTTPNNVTSIYGASAAARLADPADPGRVFTWRLERTYDDRGNCVEYQYKAEDLVGVDTASVAEQHRLSGRALVANTYLKRVRYGNATPYHPIDHPVVDHHLELVFDYGDHNPATPTPTEDRPWPARPDPFSSCRAGFEVRTYRLCQRVLMFHRFDELSPAPQLVASLRLIHAVQSPGLSFLVEVESAGHRPSAGGGFTSKTLPPMSIDYSSLEWSTAVHEVDEGSSEHIPAGVGGGAARWVDLEGTGLPGVLIETRDCWRFKPNLGDGRLGPSRVVQAKPNVDGVRDGDLMLLDIEGDGRFRAVAIGRGIQGTFEPDDEGAWQTFRPFAAVPTSIPRQTRLIDLTGDGRPDLLIDEDQAVCWYEGKGREGFAPPERVRRRLDDDATPQLIHASADEGVFLADMSGDGLADVVRIRAAEISYWPNLGYGRFGPRVVMANAPRIEAEGDFDPRRIRLADVDGSGTADLLYVGSTAARLWMNSCGNEWVAGLIVAPLPGLHSAATVELADVLGSGTVSLVWSSSLPADRRAPMRYVDLLGGRKPHLLTGYRNNTGKEVRLGYTPSTRYFLEAARTPQPWVSAAPFAVHCVSRVESIDHVTGNRLSTMYRYHHGYFDRAEREFRGFARVDQLDTEDFDALTALGAANATDPALHQPPVLTRTWYHTGQWMGHEKVLTQFAHEYYRNPVLPDRGPLPPELPAGLTPDEQRQAVRACKGLLLRTETFALDGSADAPHPYLVSENSCKVAVLQPAAGRAAAVFRVTPTETLTYHYERDPAEPRVAHTLVLEEDDRGNVLVATSVVYPRPSTNAGLPRPVQNAQAQTLISVTEAEYTADVETGAPDRVFRLREPFTSRTYELTNAPRAAAFYTADELRRALAVATDAGLEETPTGTARRLLSEHRTEYLRDDLTGPLPFGTIGALGLVHRVYSAAFTDSLLADLYGNRVDDAMLLAAGYLELDGKWWAPSGRSRFETDAPQHFYLPSGTVDPMGQTTTVDYDAHDLLVVSITDPLGNVVTARNDYVVLGPDLVTDPNDNRVAVQLDELGVAVATAVMGKAGLAQGDTLNDPTVRVEYDLEQWRTKQKPNFHRTILRERHGAANPRVQERYAYSDGFGNLVLTKVQAEPGLARRFDPIAGGVVEVDTTPNVRWIGTGRHIVNNKGNPVRSYEPYFSVTREYEDAAELVQTGATTSLHYDPVGRVVRTDLPDGTFVRSVLHAWQNVLHDANDTVRQSEWYAARGSPDPAGAEPADPDQRAAWLSARHADTPAVVHFDTLGRPVLAVADNGAGDLRTTRSELDVTGSRFRVFDAHDRLMAGAKSNMVGAVCSAESAERGQRWTLLDVGGQLMWTADEHGREFRNEYDVLRRPARVLMREGAGATQVVVVNVWGEGHPQSRDRNLRGRLYRTFDQAGTTASPSYDFKGNPTASERRFATEYRTTIDWTGLATAPDIASMETAAAASLSGLTYTGTVEYDALGRLITAQLPDGTRLQPTYNEANALNGMSAQLRGAGPFRPVVVDQELDAKGQLLVTRHGNGTTTRRTFDPDMGRPTRLTLTRTSDNAVLQDLHYTYDAVGNPVESRDDAQQTIFFANAVVSPRWRYAYDAIYQLVSASGREHAGVNAPSDHRLPSINPLPHPDDAAAVRTYTETFEYDVLGNILSVRHHAGPGTWSRRYRYAYQDNPTDRTNRLVGTSLPGDGPQEFSGAYTYDPVGNMATTPHVAALDWAFGDRLRHVDLGGGGHAYYVYGAGGQRLRKVVERTSNFRQERVYLGSVEIERELQGGTVAVERETVHIDTGGSVADILTKTVDTADPNGLGQSVFRYQHGNMLGSATLETDDTGLLLSYEEYHPYGTTAYRSGRSQAETSLKRYRFACGERDDETGLYLFGLRYYLPWLGRWTSPDPAGLAAGSNLYRYASNNPVAQHDPEGINGQTVVGQVEIPKGLAPFMSQQTAAARQRFEEWGIGRQFVVDGVARRITGVQWHEGHWAFTTEEVSATPEDTEESDSPNAGGSGGGDANAPPAGSPNGSGGNGSNGANGGTGSGGNGPGGSGASGSGPGAGANGAGPGASSGSGQRDGATGPGSSPSPRPDAATHAGPVVERGVWSRSFRDRGFTLEHLYNNDIPNAIRAQGDNRPLYDVETNTQVQQIKSSNGNSTTLANHASKATRDAGRAIANNPTGTMAGKAPQAVVITPTDAPATAGADIRRGYNNISEPVPNSVPPEHVRGVPGHVGTVGRGLTVGGTGVSGAFLVHDLYTGDYPMAGADAISTVGGGLEIYALAAPGATVAGVSAMSAGLALGGVGIAVGSGIGAYRAYKRGDTPGVVAGVIGVLAGIAIVAGVIFSAPALLIGGLIAAAAVGIFHLCRWLAS